MLAKYLQEGDAVERCGLVLGNGHTIEVENIAEDPTISFMIDPVEMIKDSRHVKGTWHTHPGQPANLSHADYAGFLNWPDLTHHIIGIDGVRSYRVEAGLVVNVK